MLTVDDMEGGLLLVQADGQLTAEDYFEFVTRLEWFANGRMSPVRMLIVLRRDFKGWSLDRLFDGLKLEQAGAPPIARIAILGDARWRGWGERKMGTALVGETRFFETGCRPDAEQWLRTPPGPGPARADTEGRNSGKREDGQ